MIEDYLTIYTVKETSKMLKTSRQQVRRMIRGGELTAVKVGREWRISDDDLRRFLATKMDIDNLKQTNKKEIVTQQLYEEEKYE